MDSQFQIVIIQEGLWYVAKCVENNVASQGRTVEEAVANLKEALQLYYDDDSAPIGGATT
ncbi:MAG: type II toxin-antitoxin system HicB family antitoxin [Phycisphaerae bacterium]|nr:type II toxin-antitoxin system HicB family antitoxin [Phycisphaerae bacterium]